MILLLTKYYYYGDENKEEEMDGAYITHWRDKKNTHKILTGKPALKKSREKFRPRW